MTISYEALNLGILAPSTALPNHIKGTMLSEAVLHVADTPETTIAIQQYTAPAFTFIIKSCHCTQPLELITNINTNAWLWQALLQGDAIQTQDLQNEKGLIKNCLLFSSLTGNTIKTTIPAPGTYTILEILINKALLGEFKTLFPSLNNHSPAQTISLDTELHTYIRAILEARMSGNLWNFFIESRVKDILFHTCSKIAAAAINTIHILEKELQAVHKAAELIVADLSVHIAIPQLARLVNLNEFKLKKFFPLVHGKTIYAYFTHQRMLKAKELFLQNLSVKEVAKILGYRPSDLTMTFIQHFGIKPSKFRKANR